MKKYFILILGFLMGSACVGQVKPQPGAVPVPFDSMAFYNNTKKPAISDPVVTEYAPTIQADGKTMIFEASSKGRSYILSQSHLNNKEWTQLEPLKKINSSTDSMDLIGGPNLSFDGNTLYFFRTVGRNANHEIYYSTREKDGWGVPVNIGAPINTDGYEGFPSISADGTALYFVRQNVEGPQSKDLKKIDQFCYSIYRSVKSKEGNWSVLKNYHVPLIRTAKKLLGSWRMAGL